MSGLSVDESARLRFLRVSRGGKAKLALNIVR